MRLNGAIHPITFNVNFGTGKIDATDIRGVNTTTFNLDFTATGIITGNVVINVSGSADNTTEARGLIGEQGLVGGFANKSGGFGGQVYGGFVAENPSYTPPTN